MPKDYYLPSDDEGKRLWLNHFASKLAVHAAALGIDPAIVTSVANDAAFFAYVLVSNLLFKEDGPGRTQYKNTLRDGPESVPLGDYPAAPIPGPPPATVPPGIFVRVRRLVQQIKNMPAYTEAIGQTLDIIGAENTDDPATWQPALAYALMAGKPLIEWIKGGADALLIYVDRGDGNGFQFLTQDTHPDYLDTAPLPPPGESAVWKYRAIYILGDEQVGAWSDVLELTVQGAV